MRYLTFFVLLLGISCAFAQPDLSLEEFASGFVKPVKVTNSGISGDERLFVVEQPGRIKILNSDGLSNAVPFLDITGRVQSDGNEQGLLGLAFPPDYAATGIFYVNYTSGNGAGRTRISRFMRDPSDPDLALSASEEIILDFNQPFTNHNGGDLAFGPDGYLYIATGDGGSFGDPDGNAQNTGNLLGNILRIDVDTSASYKIPADNPFVGSPPAREEIWANGMRNPWRISFDRLTGDFWVGDVGQNAREEVNVQLAGVPGGLNYGWDCFEGGQVFPLGPPNCNDNYTFPIFSYPHNNTAGGFSITGGYVYRGSEMPHIQGDYIFCDYVSGNFWQTSVNDTTGDWQTFRQNGVGAFISSFGEDVNGELYACGLSGGIIYKVLADCPDVTVNATVSQNGDDMEVDWDFGQFQWFLNGDPIDGATDNTYSVEALGDYSAEVTVNVQGCRYTASADPVTYECGFAACDATITLQNDTIFSNCTTGVVTWTLNGAPLPALDGQTFIVPDQSGTYQMEVYDSLSSICVRTLSSNTVEVVISSVGQQVTTLSDLHPNPARHSVNIGFSGPLTSLDLSDTEGRSHTVPFEVSGRGIALDIRDLPAGHYIVRILSGKQVHAGSFIKQ